MRSSQVLALFFLGTILAAVPHSNFIRWSSGQQSIDSPHYLCWGVEGLEFTDESCNSETGNSDVPVAYSALFFSKISLSKADYDILLTIPGVGPVLAAKIIAFRDRKGEIKELGELLQVYGIGEKKLAKIKEYLTH